MPNIADWGGLMIGVPNIEPYTPPLDTVNVPPSISSMASVPSLAYECCIRVVDQQTTQVSRIKSNNKATSIMK